MIRSAVLAAALVLPRDGSAQDAEEALPAVRGCLEAAEDEAASRACIGAFAQSCMAESPGGDTTVGMTACTLAEAGAWDRILNETFGDLVLQSHALAAGEDQAGVPPAPREQLLRAAQRAWVAFRDADCAQEVAMWGEGSMRQIAGAYCALDRTAQRTFELRAKRAALEGN
jgi:uncharacterized protein YecT (DUF1311 family)